MLLPLLVVLGAMQAPSDTVRSLTFAGRAGALAVPLPRQETEVTVDGQLDEAAWRQAAKLNGFSQYSPSDGVPAADSTEVLVWYSPHAIYFGIRAFEAHGAVHATLADRDRIFTDDNVQILLSTFNDGRQADFFAVNPLGVQGDGVLVESGRSGTNFTGGIVIREAPDLSPDYVFQSKGRVTKDGYVVEVRIPFKSLRFRSGNAQTWGLNVLRAVKHSGFEDVWAPARRANASFLGQGGRLTGLTDLRRGLVVDFTPELTSKVSGARATGGAWNYDGGKPEVGGTVRWGVTNNLTLNGTIKPDFSQVESDAGQIVLDPRQALFFSEKRPFFLDGIEQFQVANNLIYTRRIVQPVAAVKLTGNVAGTNIGLLSAVDDRDASATLDHPIYNILRAQRDVGRQSRLGLVYTDKIDGDNYNRLASVDGRILFGKVWSTQFQFAGSRTRESGTVATAPLWSLRLDRNGHTVGFRSLFSGIGDDFRAGAGFIGRAGVVRANLNPSLTFYGKPGAAVERFTVDMVLDGTWQYDHFVHGRGIQDQKFHVNGNASLRGGWNLAAGFFGETFGYDSTLYANYAIEIPRTGGGLDTIPFTGTPTLPNYEGFVQVGTPTWKHFDAVFFQFYGHDENFFEWSSSLLLVTNATVNWRPTEKMRFSLSYFLQRVARATDRSRVNIGQIPRLKIEYQIARPLFVRLVGQYASSETDSLRDDGRTNGTILFHDATTNTFTRSAPDRSNTFHGDLLVSYQPTPGTVLFAGYGSTVEDTRAFRFSDLRRMDDGFFVKMSYLFRM